jgi:hypothetical protein
MIFRQRTITGEDNVIAIRGFAEPSTPRTRQILESDLGDKAARRFLEFFAATSAGARATPGLVRMGG